MLIDSVAARALQFTILTAARSGETFGAVWDEVSFDEAIWRIPASRMKMKQLHEVPLSDAAISILRAQEAKRGRNPHCFPGARPMQKLSATAMSTIMRRLGAGAFTVHGMRSAFRDWAAKQGVEFEVAEAALAHAIGSKVTRAYLRTTVPELRRPVMQAWADYVTGKTIDNVLPFRPAVTA